MGSSVERLARRASWSWVVFSLVACAGSTPGPEPGGRPAGEIGAPPPTAESGVEIPEPRLEPARAITLADLPWQPESIQISEAEELIARQHLGEALEKLSGLESPAASLVKARVLRAMGDLDAAEQAIADARADRALEGLLALEQGQVFLTRGACGVAAGELMAVFSGHENLASRAVGPLAEALVVSNPTELLRRYEELEAALPAQISARSRLLDAKARALKKLGRADEALAVEVQRYLEEPVSSETPSEPPAAATLTSSQLLARAEVLLAAHRNERVIEAMADIREEELTPEQRCRFQFDRGLVHRKLHHYAAAERDLVQVYEACADEDLVRRAMYLAAKVISIKSGLSAVPVIEAFAKRFAGHSMIDDVLFWAGDLYQRRGQDEEAVAYYTRVIGQTPSGDHCADARWRLAWIAYRSGDLAAAKERLAATVAVDGCAGTVNRARAQYWLARVAAQQGDIAAAKVGYEKTFEISALGFYGQMALGRLLAQEPESRRAWREELRAPEGEEVPALCPGWLATTPAVTRALALLIRGLGTDAAEELRAIAEPEAPYANEDELTGETLASAQGRGAPAAEPLEASSSASTEDCGAGDPALLLALLLGRAGAHREGHKRLRAALGDGLERFPAPEKIGIFRAAYPLAYRAALGAAEEEHGLPPLLLQALAREESAFDAEVVSWAGAYGLTQLLFSTGQRTGEKLEPPVRLEDPEELLEPELNARLGGALFASLMQRYKGYPPLCLVAYNAGEEFAGTLWRRHAAHDFDRFAEEITIRETRSYVKRVLKTYGVYRWLYGEEPPELPIDFTLPKLD